MKHLFFFMALFIVNVGHSQTQQPGQSVSDYQLFNMPTVRSSVQELDQVTQGTLFSLDELVMQQLRTDSPENFTLTVPNLHGDELVLELGQVSIFSEDFILETSGAEDLTAVDLGLHYRGTIQGKKGSVVAVSVFSDQIRGVAVDGTNNYNLGPIELGSTDYICYRSSDLAEDIKSALNYTCGSTESEGDVYSEDELNFAEKGLGDVVRIYVEVDRSIYVGQGNSVSAAVAYTTSLVNQNAAIYFQEGIGTVASQIFVWSTTDPYDGVNGCSTDIRDKYLCDFQAQFAGFNGDLALLLIDENIGGVAAGFSGLCNANPDNSMCISGQSGTTVNTFPVYSYNTYIFAHELGHLFGSRHTHACVWNGNNTAIDGCEITEGSCPQPPIPASGSATVMSYCQTQLAGGYISTAPFGPQPGNVIRASVAGSSCLGCANPTIYIPSTTSAGPAIYLCPGELAPAGYVLAASQSCAQTIIDNDPFCLGANGGTWDAICAFDYNACLDGCSIYLPNAATTGPGIYVCPGEPVPSGYLLAIDQDCAASVLNSDAYCLTNIWDGICSNAYFACMGGCSGTSFAIFLPQVGVSGPAVIQCPGEPAPSGYFLASSQSCAQQIIENDPYCLTNFWDSFCVTAYETCNPPTCADGIQNGDELAVDCGGPDCPACPCLEDGSIYLPVSPTIGPAVIVCAVNPAPAGYVMASNQACAQAVIDNDPFCLETNWDSFCQSAYAACTGESCTGATTIYLPDTGVSGPAIQGCGLTPVGYTAAEDQVCAQQVIDADPFCLTDFWDSICQSAYDACINPPCQSPSNLDVVEIGFGTANARVNATWNNPEGTTSCEVRGGRISPASYAAGEPEFANPAQTRVVTQTNGSTVLFNIILYNNPNIPFVVGQRYGYDVRCQCADGSGFSDWANITPEATFVVPAPPPGVNVGDDNKLSSAGIQTMNIFPNPAEDIVNIELEMSEEGSVEILLMNALGQTVMQDRSSGKTTVNRMDVSDLEAGIYMLSVRTTTGMITERLIVK